MACPALHTGTVFMSSALAHFDCQGRTIGAYGYSALAEPTSPVSVALTALLAIFVGLFGLRMMLGALTGTRDIVVAVAKVGIVLTLATSWPAWRITAYNVVFSGPFEIAHTIGLAAGLVTDQNQIVAHLQRVDDAIIEITSLSSKGPFGLYATQLNGPFGDTPEGIALLDKTGLSWGRISFLIGSIAPFAFVRLGAGLMLAVTPLIAGALLMGQGAWLFWGWLKSLFFLMIAGISYNLAMAAELSVIEPWLSEALAYRSGGAVLPSLPTELVVLTMTGVAVQVGLLVLIGRMTFLPHRQSSWFSMGWHSLEALSGKAYVADRKASVPSPASEMFAEGRSHADRVISSVETALRRERLTDIVVSSRDVRPAEPERRVALLGLGRPDDPEAVGGTFRRNRRQQSNAGVERDRRS